MRAGSVRCVRHAFVTFVYFGLIQSLITHTFQGEGTLHPSAHLAWRIWVLFHTKNVPNVSDQSLPILEKYRPKRVPRVSLLCQLTLCRCSCAVLGVPSVLSQVCSDLCVLRTIPSLNGDSITPPGVVDILTCVVLCFNMHSSLTVF